MFAGTKVNCLVILSMQRDLQPNLDDTNPNPSIPYHPSQWVSLNANNASAALRRGVHPLDTSCINIIKHTSVRWHLRSTFGSQSFKKVKCFKFCYSCDTFSLLIHFCSRHQQVSNGTLLRLVASSPNFYSLVTPRHGLFFCFAFAGKLYRVWCQHLSPEMVTVCVVMRLPGDTTLSTKPDIAHSCLCLKGSQLIYRGHDRVQSRHFVLWRGENGAGLLHSLWGGQVTVTQYWQWNVQSSTTVFLLDTWPGGENLQI